MPNGIKKENLPSKVCVICNRPFTWRKKWEVVWDEVTTCSKSCNHKRRALNQQANRQEKNHTAMLSSSSSTMLQDEREVTLTKENRQRKDPGDEAEEVESNENGAEKDEVFNDNAMDLSLLRDIMYHETHESNSLSDSDSTDIPVRTNNTDGNDYIVLSSSSSVDSRAARKEAKKRVKQERRAKRQGLDPSYGQKECQVCLKSVDLLIRCTIDASSEWKMVCGKCWHSVSGGIVDGDASHPYYRYGGLWKNRAKRV